MSRSMYYPKGYTPDIAIKYSAFLRGKRVAIVGGADNYDKRRVDRNFDVVVRINNHVVRQRGACHVIYHTVCGDSLENDPLLQSKSVAPEFVFLNLVDSKAEAGLTLEPRRNLYARHFNKAKIGYFAQGEWKIKNPYGKEFEWLPEVHRQFNCKLLTGLVAVADMLRFSPAEVFVCGMNLYINSQRGVPGYRDSHRLAGQVDFLKHAMKKSHVFLDTPLKQSIYEYEKRFTNDPTVQETTGRKVNSVTWRS